MRQLLSFLADNRAGILLLLVVLLALGLLVNWLLWMLGWGRFKAHAAPGHADSKLRYVVANFFVEIINDFRHLLALVIVLLFAVTLFAAMLPGMISGDVDVVKDGLQAVAAALGGLIGSIIGYYFGESAATKRETPPPSPPSSPEAVQATPPPTGSVSGVTPAPKPPNIE